MVNVPSEDLESVIAELETKVATLNTTLDGKASGGSGTSIETCTVTVKNAQNLAFYGTSIVDGVVSLFLYSASEFTCTLIKNTYLMVADDAWAYNLAGTVCDGVDNANTHCEAGVAIFEITGDTASLEFVMR